MEDASYTENIGIRLEDATARFALIEDVEYYVKLWISPGDHYCGESKTTFKLKKAVPAGQQLTIDFRGQRITDLKINGKASHGADLFKKQKIHLDSSLLKPAGELNEVTFLLKNEYRKDGYGLYQFTDPVDKKQYLSSQFESDYCRYSVPVFDQPDIKAKWTFECAVQKGWTVISNEA
jgi:aminopeptidase N